MQYASKTFFVYETDYDASLGPSDDVTLNFNTHGDSDFFWQKFAMFALVDGEATVISENQVPAIYMSVTNVTSGRTLSNAPVSVPNVEGYLQFNPMITVWPRKSSIQVFLENFDIGPTGTTYSRLQLSFMGTKAFPKVSANV
jgi:hypothetical protein